jgi:PAS domain S-box-containing protein
VEDAPELCVLLKRVFTLKGYAVKTVLNGTDALTVFREETPELVVLDYHLPDFKGDKILEEILATRARTAVVVMTADPRPEIALQVMRLGARAYIRKPFDPEYLTALCVKARREVALLNVETLLEERTKELRASKEFLSRIFYLSPSAITISRISDSSFIDVNESFCIRTGYRREEVIGRSALDLGIWADLSTRANMLELLKRGGEFSNFEVRFCKKDGEALVGLMSGKIVELDGEPCLLSVTTDITDLKRIDAERTRLEEQLRQAQKLESVGRLAASVAHDFNNLLSPIMAYAEMLQADFPMEDRRGERISQILKASRRGRDLTKQLLAFSRKQVLDLKTVDLRDVVLNFEKLLRRTIREDIQIHLDLPSALDRVRIDVGQMEQVLLNLAVNAQDAMPEGGLLTISLERSTDSQAVRKVSSGTASQHQVVLTVTDNGCGMSQDTISRIFEPFFTTKEAGKGTGLGLSTVFGIVKQHDGHVQVLSEPGFGSSFKIFLPAAEGIDEGKENVPQTLSETYSQKYTVLLVEDDPMVRESTCQMLEREGYWVLAYEEPEAVLRIVESFAVPIDLLLTDVVMPHMNGRDLHRKLLARRPGLKALFMSGYSQDVVAQHGIMKDGFHFIQKPFSFQELAQKIHEAMGSDKIDQQ